MDLKSVCTFLLMLFFFSSPLIADQALNQTDSEGRKQGRWVTRYPGGSVMYEGYFRDDRPEGEFKRFYENGTMKSVMLFSNNGMDAIATLYYENGFVASKGKYINQLKEGKWQFFSMLTEGILVSEEEFRLNLRNGTTVKYYPDGTVAEKISYSNDIKNGEWLKFYPDGSPGLKAWYQMGRINGKFESYFENGKLQFSGYYLSDLKDGEWKIFNENGTLKYSIVYKLGMTDSKVIDIQQTNYIDSLEKNSINVQDPEKNPDLWQ